MVMIMVNIHEAKAKLSTYLEAVARGERVVICNRNRPIAELRAVEARRTTPRPVGLAKGRFKVPASFFEPLPDDVLDAFEGKASDAHGLSRERAKRGGARRSVRSRRR